MDMKIIVLLKGSWCLEKTDFYQIIRQLKAKTTSSLSIRKGVAERFLESSIMGNKATPEARAETGILG